jgi:hypothetical protein
MLNHNEIRARMLKIIATESDDTAWTISNKHLMSIIKMYVEEEREACAEICENYADVDTYPDGIIQDYHSHLIRLRGKE